MLRKMEKPNLTGAAVKICDASFPTPFSAGLEYNAPVRGPWNIVNTGMLIPNSHQIFVCAEGCLRGVILTAAEMNAMDRMSWVAVKENDLIDGTLEEQIVDGVTDILYKMDTLSPVVLVFVSCIHLFSGCRLDLALSTLRERFPGVDFVDCYMAPTMRKSGLTPDETMRRQLYAPLKPVPRKARAVNLIGNDCPTDESSELCGMIKDAGYCLRDITRCKTYAEYQEMASSAVNITYQPAAKAAGDALEHRLGQKHLALPLSYSSGEIIENYRRLSSCLGIPLPDFSRGQARAGDALRKAREVIGQTPVDLDYTATPRPLSLARLLAEYGFRVRTIYADGFSDEERPDFLWLREHAPDLMICATLDAGMRFHAGQARETVLAIGQKAAYFSGTRHFVNMIEGGGMYGFDGIARLAEKMREAFFYEKDTRTLISRKGLGCESCL